MPVTPLPDQHLAQTISRMQKQINELTRAIGKPSDSVRDNNNNVVALVPGTQYATLASRGQDASLVMGNASVTVADETGRNTRPIAAANFVGPLTGDSTGIHHGDVGTTTEAHNHYGDLHGNGYGFWYGPVGDGTTQNQINATNVYANFFYGDGGVSGSNFNYNGQFWGTLHGNVVAPSEARMKTEVKGCRAAGWVVDEVPAYRWRWRQDAMPAGRQPDTDEHVGPMVDDLAEVAPWLIRDVDGDTRGYSDRDMIGLLWAALRETRGQLKALSARWEY